jgi:hypothetical protein
MPNESFINSTSGYNPYGGSQMPSPKRPLHMLCQCGCPFLEEKKVARWTAENSNVIGTPVMSVDGPYYIYVCIACGQVV